MYINRYEGNRILFINYTVYKEMDLLPIPNLVVTKSMAASISHKNTNTTKSVPLTKIAKGK
jgi:hypothetical protein